MQWRKLRALTTVGFGLIASVGSAEEKGAVELAATPPALKLEDGAKVVFLGDSITHQCLYTQFIEDYYYTRYPKLKIQFRNAGISGDKAEQALLRFDADVAAFEPDVVTVLLGMNDAGYVRYDEEIFKDYEGGMNAIFEKIEGIGAQAIPMGPTPFDSRQSGINPPHWVAPTPVRLADLKNYYGSVLAYYGAWVGDRATELGLRYVDLAGPLGRLTAESRVKEPTFTMIPDAVHPDANGHAVMAFSILDQLGVSNVVSAIDASPETKTGDWDVRARGGEVSKVEKTGTGVRFTFLAEALPWVLPEQAALGYSLTKAGHKLSNERLVVSGLEPGNYELLIDGHVVGTYPHSRLAASVELQENVSTPQYQQALAVALANLKRNDIGVKPMRNLWPQHREGKLTDADFEKATADIERVIALYDEKIFEIRQPEKHVYEVRRKEAP